MHHYQISALARIFHKLWGYLHNLSRHFRPQIPSPYQFDNVLGYLRANLMQHLAQLTSRFYEISGLDD